MRALVTGATGLIGAHLVRALVDAGHELPCLVRQTSRRDSLEGLPVTWVVDDLLHDSRVLDAACAECDAAFHTAAEYAYWGISSTEILDTAVAGTEALLRACDRQGVRTVVVTSSSVIFGHSKRGTIIGEDEPVASSDGEAPYVIAKIAQHHRAQDLLNTSQTGCALRVPDDDAWTDEFAPGTEQWSDSVVPYRSFQQHVPRRLQHRVGAQRCRRPSAHRVEWHRQANPICSAQKT